MLGARVTRNKIASLLQMAYIELAKMFVWVLPSDRTENPNELFG